MTRKAIVIGVADAKPLAYLAGALNGAKDFANWSRALGYSTRLVTDEKKPVTMARLCAAFESVLRPTGAGPAGPIDRLVVYFAGHGLIREAEEGLWLLSDWYNKLRAVAVDSLKRRLYAFDVRQIAIFADACRELPPDVVAADLVPDAVIGRGPGRGPSAPPVDKFIAAQDGAQAYMAPGDSPEEDRCIFSGVLMEGLWGAKPEALAQGKVTSLSLAAFLSSETPRVAKRYGCSLHPAVYPLLGNEIYFDPASGPPAPPMPWPAPPPPAPPSAAGPTSRRAALGFETRGGAGPAPAPPPPANAVRARRDRQAGKRLRATLERPIAFDLQPDEAGVFADRPVRSLWAGGGIGVSRQENGWRVHAGEARLATPEPLLAEFEDGAWAALTALPGFIARIFRDDNGVAALLYEESGIPPRPVLNPNALDRTIAAIVAMEGGGLRAPEVLDKAVELRQFKHEDPMLGVISAYLYDAVGDVESIRRMAAYYVDHHQPIPYDIALLALVPAEQRGRSLWVSIPAVPARPPRTTLEKAHDWTFSAMEPCEGEVAGGWPWMRQGWAFIDDPLDPERDLIRNGLAAAGRRLKPARFATMDEEGARRLAAIFGLQRADAGVRVQSAERGAVET